LRTVLSFYSSPSPLAATRSAWPASWKDIHGAPLDGGEDPAASGGGAAPKAREGTKQEQVLAMLRRPEGATVAQIAEATGWAQHTVRGFFAGLKRRATRSR
jgi:hypothetical protein